MASKWLPRGWGIVTSSYPTGGKKFQFEAHADGIPKFTSDYAYTCEMKAYKAAEIYLRSQAFKEFEPQTSQKRIHWVMKGQTIALCGAVIRSNNSSIKYCAKCREIYGKILQEAQAACLIKPENTPPGQADGQTALGTAAVTSQSTPTAAVITSCPAPKNGAMPTTNI